MFGFPLAAGNLDGEDQSTFCASTFLFGRCESSFCCCLKPALHFQQELWKVSAIYRCGSAGAPCSLHPLLPSPPSCVSLLELVWIFMLQCAVWLARSLPSHDTFSNLGRAVSHSPPPFPSLPRVFCFHFLCKRVLVAWQHCFVLLWLNLAWILTFHDKKLVLV